MPDVLNIAVVDDHELLRVGVARAVAAVPGWNVSHSVGSVDELLGANLDDVDLVVLDLVTPGAVSGLAAIDVLRARDLDVVVLTAVDVMHVEADARRRGAIAVVGKGEGPDRLRDAITAAAGLPAYEGVKLTPRELDVLRSIRAGQRNQEIARSLDISLSAVKRHIEHIMEKTDVRTRNGLAALPVDA
jgi:two-component system, NarL family, response regulator LiaR